MKINVSRLEAKNLLEERIKSGHALTATIEAAPDFYSAYGDFKRTLNKWRSYNEDLLQRIYGIDAKAVTEYRNTSTGGFLLIDQDTHDEYQSYKHELQNEIANLESCIERLDLYETTTVSPKAKTGLHKYVNPSRMEALRGLKGYDPGKLIRLCEELNQSFQAENFLSTIMLLRAVLDHVPPIFGVDSFSKVANNYAGSKSFKESMSRLESSSRKIADAHLHTQIRPKESLPNATQVDFSNDLDVLLAETVRIGCEHV